MRKPDIKRALLILLLLAAIAWAGKAALDGRVPGKAIRFARALDASGNATIPVSLVEKILLGLYYMQGRGCDTPPAPATRPT